MKIYVYNNDEFYDGSQFEIVKYVSEHIPRIGEIVYFPHIGGFYVRNVAYQISDDANCNNVMWVELGVEPLKKETKE